MEIDKKLQLNMTKSEKPTYMCYIKNNMPSAYLLIDDQVSLTGEQHLGRPARCDIIIVSVSL